jgi:hypothetical protein
VPDLLAAVTAGLAPALIFLLIALATDLWVYLDAERQRDAGEPVVLVVGGLRIETPQAWLVACLVLWIVAVPLYLTGRRR